VATTLNRAHRLGNPPPRRVAIVRALPGLGDLLCAVPALRALRRALPEARLTLIGLPQARALVARFGRYLDDFLEFPGFPGIVEREPDIRGFPDFLSAAHARRFDLAIQMHGSGIVTNLFTALLGARLMAGCYLPGMYCPDPDRFLPYPSHEPEIRRNLRLMEFLGAPCQGEDLEFPLAPDDEAAAQFVVEAHGLVPGRYACVHPGAATPDRCWPAERFAAVADALAARGLRVVLTGTAAEAALTRRVAGLMTAPSIDLTGRTTIGALAVVLRDARLLVANDTGVAHLAAALRVPSVVIFSASDPARWAPLDRVRHRALAPAAVSEAGCSCAAPHRCLRDGCIARPARPEPGIGVEPQEVLAAMDDLLQQEHTHAS
jgi:ADP-heptose:LPS heptosyltransferase